MSLRQAINAHCKACIYDPGSGLGNWRQQVEGCTAKSCALFPFRPVSHPEQRKRQATGTTPAVRQKKTAEERS